MQNGDPEKLRLGWQSLSNGIRHLDSFTCDMLYYAGDRKVKEVHVSHDFGATWIKADLSDPPNSHSWQTWKAEVPLPSHGYYEVWARATDEAGAMQPFALAWNPKGYLNNSMHRIALRVAA